jgi:hypothetical protein
VEPLRGYQGERRTAPRDCKQGTSAASQAADKLGKESPSSLAEKAAVILRACDFFILTFVDWFYK